MKMLSQILKLTFISFMLVSSVAQARSSIVARSFSVVGLEAFKGKRLSVFYVSARPATLETPGQIARVRKVMKGPLTFVINHNGEVDIPETEVPRDGWANFNHLIFVIHAQPKHALQNVDGSMPEFLDSENIVPFKTETAQYLFRKSVDLSNLKDPLNLF